MRWSAPPICIRDTSNSCTPSAIRRALRADCRWYPSRTGQLVGREETDDLSEAENVRWFPVDALPELAFDHRRIIEYALQRLRARVDQPDVVTTLVGETFTLNQLHGVYEAVAGTSIDLANFRRRMLATGRIEETGERRREGRHRPAAVYRYTPRRSRSRRAIRRGAATIGVVDPVVGAERHISIQSRSADAGGVIPVGACLIAPLTPASCRTAARRARQIKDKDILEGAQ